MKSLTGLPVDAFVLVSRESKIPLKDLLELVQQVENGATPAFLARYRADLCAGMDEEQVHGVLRALNGRRELIDHRISMLTTLGQRGALTPELKKQLEAAADRRELNDIFGPYRARKRGPADIAIERGLDPLARTLWFQEDGVDIEAEAARHVDPGKGVETAEKALNGAYSIASRWLGDKPEILRELRMLCQRDCELVVTAKPAARREPRYRAMDGLRVKASEIGWQKRLSMRRGVRTGLVDVKAEFPLEEAAEYLQRCLIKDTESAYAPHLKRVVDSALQDGLVDRVRRDVLRELDKRADREAVDSYRKTLRDALLAPAADGLNIIGVETGRPGGWRAALVDARGELIDYAIVRDPERGSGQRRNAHSSGKVPEAAIRVVAAAQSSAPPLPTVTQDQAAAPAPETSTPAASGDGAVEAGSKAPEPESSPGDSGPEGAPAPKAKGKRRARQLARRAELSDILAAHDVDLIVFPTGPRKRTTEQFLRSQIRKSGKIDTRWLAVRDSGTWIYAASKTAKREFPRLDPAFRSAISLARRVLDPMAELVKTDPRTVGIGVHHHEVNPEMLRESLRLTVQRAVHDAGVDVNRASMPLLSLVPGFTDRLARRVVNYRKRNGPFQSRADLRKVDGLSDRIFAQAVGFLRVQGADPLDATGAHPEYGELHDRFAEAAGCDLPTLLAEPERLDAVAPEQFVTPERSVLLVRSAMDELRLSRRTVRGKFKLPEPPVPLRPDEQLVPGSKVEGVVASVADFGVFVDIGADQDALLHVSQISPKYKSESKPNLKTGASLEVFIKPADQSRRRIGLTMWAPGSRPGRNRNGGPRLGAGRPDGGPRRRGRGRGWQDRRTPFNRTFGPDSGRRRKGGRKKMSMEEKLDMLQDRYRTKI